MGAHVVANCHHGTADDLRSQRIHGSTLRRRMLFYTLSSLFCSSGPPLLCLLAPQTAPCAQLRSALLSITPTAAGNLRKRNVFPHVLERDPRATPTWI